MKQFTLGLLCAPIAALVLALALNISPRTEMGGSGSFNIVFGALWAFVFVWGVGLRALPIRDSLLWGAAYGLLGWIIRPVTIGGVLNGRGVLWSLPEFTELFPDLIAYILYGIALGLRYPLLYQVYVMRQTLAFRREVRSAAIRGGTAGVVVGLIFINRLPFLGLLPVPGMHPETTLGILYLLLSVIVGGVLGLVIEQAQERSGVSLIRGMTHGISPTGEGESVGTGSRSDSPRCLRRGAGGEVLRNSSL